MRRSGSGPERARAGRSRPRFALTGTPGTGKSAVARALGGPPRCVEVGDLALRLGCASGRGRGVVVDLARLARRIDRGDAAGVDVVVGHLAHLLPVRKVVLLRCDPRELADRLRRARRGSPRLRAENVLAEAVDVLRVEAERLGRSVVEVDTTGRSPAAVAREVRRRIRGRWRATRRGVDWLGDPAVTDYLLRGGP